MTDVRALTKAVCFKVLFVSPDLADLYSMHRFRLLLYLKNVIQTLLTYKSPCLTRGWVVDKSKMHQYGQQLRLLLVICTCSDFDVPVLVGE